jgi:NAD(P)H-dependent flavin oxidoreductase YrpB (nitropropane dioxygenase family)
MDANISICERLGCETPIFAFSHCRDVVVEVTRAGGFGVLGAGSHTPDQLEHELDWIDRHVGGRSYGVDVVMTTSYDESAEEITGPLIDVLPEEHKRFVSALLDAEGVPPVPPAIERQILEERAERDRNATRWGARRLVDVALKHPQVKLVVNALGVPPRDLVDELHGRGILVGGLCGKPEHATYHLQGGVDVLIAQGSEAGGHTGGISTMVLTPQIVAACAGSGVAVLAAGGITSGRHIAATEALGADGVWIGSLWLGTRESDWLPHEKEAVYRATSSDTVQSKCMSGKSVRMLRSRFSDAWNRPDAPAPLPAPFQSVLFRWAKDRISRAARTDLFSGPAGQGVGTISGEESVRDVMYRLQEEYLEAVDRVTQRARRLAHVEPS